MTWQEYEGDLLTAKVDVIAHQCNTTTKSVAGLAAAVYAKYPVANYQLHVNPEPRRYGMVDLVTIFPGHDHGYVANLYAQVLPGGPTWGLDSRERRLQAFNECLDDLAAAMQQVGAKSVAFPARIGCDLGGGIWDSYYRALRDWYIHRTGCSRNLNLTAPHYHWFDVHIVELKR